MADTTHFPRRIALICGGPSSEFVVSLTSARSVAHSIDRHRYRVRVFCVLEDGTWVCPDEEWDGQTAPSRIEKFFDLLDYPEYCPTGFFKIHPSIEGIRRMVAWSPQMVLPIMHGAYGEDGRIQGMLDFLGVPYIGSGVQASALSMDKRRTLNFLGAHGIRVARHIVLRASTPRAHREDQLAGAGGLLGWPLIVKPSNGGSSLCTALVHNLDDLYKATMRAFEADSEVLLEEYIRGVEVSCGVLDLAEGFGGRIVCPPTEICPKGGEFFNFDSKYRPGASDEYTPARLEEAIINRIQTIAEKAHDLLGCEGLSRSDLIVPPDGQPVFLETNTMPGMTSTSLLPQQAAELGISMTAMFSGLIEGVFESLVEKTAREEQ